MPTEPASPDEPTPAPVPPTRSDEDDRRRLEDAVLALWAELPNEQVRLLRDEAPALVEYVGHLHHAIEHHEAMVRRNVWSVPAPVPPAMVVCPTCDGQPKRQDLRVEGGSLSCRFCNRTLTFNFMRDTDARRCSCRRSREAECPTCLGEGEVPAPVPTKHERIAGATVYCSCGKGWPCPDALELARASDWTPAVPVKTDTAPETPEDAVWAFGPICAECDEPATVIAIQRWCSQHAAERLCAAVSSDDLRSRIGLLHADAFGHVNDQDVRGWRLALEAVLALLASEPTPEPGDES